MIELMPGTFVFLAHNIYTVYVIVLPSMVCCVFCVARYDIKGCEVSRWTDPAPEGSQIIVVLKDLNFEGQYITLGEETECSIILTFQAGHNTVFITVPN